MPFLHTSVLLIPPLTLADFDFEGCSEQACLEAKHRFAPAVIPTAPGCISSLGSALSQTHAQTRPASPPPAAPRPLLQPRQNFGKLPGGRRLPRESSRRQRGGAVRCRQLRRARGSGPEGGGRSAANPRGREGETVTGRSPPSPGIAYLPLWVRPDPSRCVSGSKPQNSVFNPHNPVLFLNLFQPSALTRAAGGEQREPRNAVRRDPRGVPEV